MKEDAAFQTASVHRQKCDMYTNIITKYLGTISKNMHCK